MLKPGQGKTLVEATDADSLVAGSSAGFLDPACNVSIAEDEIVQKNSPWDLK